MPFIQVYLHCVWTTKYKTPYLCTPLIREKAWQHIKNYGVSRNIRILNVSGHNDHCHCLIDFNGTQTISESIGCLKGESSHWINKSGLIKPFYDEYKFQWQHEFWVVSHHAGNENEIRFLYINHPLHHLLPHPGWMSSGC